MNILNPVFSPMMFIILRWTLKNKNTHLLTNDADSHSNEIRSYIGKGPYTVPSYYQWDS